MASYLRIGITPEVTGAPVPVAAILPHLYCLGVSQDLGDLDFAAISRVLEVMGQKWGKEEE